MVTSQQRYKIKKLASRIKKAKDDGKKKEVIEERTKELYRYLEKEGIVISDDG